MSANVRVKRAATRKIEIRGEKTTAGERDLAAAVGDVSRDWRVLPLECD